MTTITAQTRLINTETGEYPVFLPQLSSKFPNTCFPTVIESEALEELFYVPVHPTPRPTGDVITEEPPELVEGVYKQAWSVRTYNEFEYSRILAIAKDEKLRLLEEFRVATVAKGFPYEFKEGVYHVQIRGTDQINLLRWRALAKEAVAESKPYILDFRTYENVSVSLNAIETIALSDRLDQQVQYGNQALWDFKELVGLAEVIEDLPDLPDHLFTL